MKSNYANGQSHEPLTDHSEEVFEPPTERLTFDQIQKNNLQLILSCTEEASLPQEEPDASSSLKPPKVAETRKKVPLMPRSGKYDPRCASTVAIPQEDVAAEVKKRLSESENPIEQEDPVLPLPKPMKDEPSKKAAPPQDVTFSSLVTHTTIKTWLVFGSLLVAAMLLSQALLILTLLLAGR